MQRSSLDLYLLGNVALDDALRLQRRLVYDFGDRDRHGAGLILCEHPPVLTIGRSGSRIHIAPRDDELRGLGLRMRWLNRGGGCVLHLPGQLAAYLVVPLEPLGLSVGGYLDRVHASIVATLAEFGLAGSTRHDCAGVFIDRARVAAVGVAVSRWVAYYGFSLNVGLYLDPFRIMNEPGPEGRSLRQTSIEARRQRPAPMPKVREALARGVADAFDLELAHIHTSHPLIRRTTPADVHVAALG